MVPMRKIDREIVLLALLILAALFIRLYRVDASLIEWSALHEANAVKTIFQGERLPLTSSERLGTLGHYGPALIYFLIPFYLVSKSFYSFHVALLLTHVAGAYFLYRFGRDFFNRETGWLAAILYAFAWFTLISSRRGNNADFVLLFAVLLFYSLVKVISAGKRQYLIIIGGCLGMLLQLHYIAFPALPAALLILVAGYFRDKERGKWLKPLAIGAAIFFLMFVPYLLFEFSNGFRETAMRLQFISGAVVGGDASSPSRGLPATVLTNARGFFSLHPHYNPFGIDLERDYLCEDASAGDALHWTGPVSQIYWLLTRAECALALVAIVVILALVLLRRNFPSSRAGASIVLLWFISGVAALLVQPWGGNAHQTFIFAPMVLLLAIVLSWIPTWLTPWRKILKTGILALCIILALSSSILFLNAVQRVAATSCLKQSVGNMPVGALIDLQERLASEFGAVPTIYFFRTQWGPKMPYLLISQPEQVPSHSLSKLTFFFLQNPDLPPGCIVSDFTYSRKDGTLFGIPSPPPYEIKYASTYSEGWHLDEFDDSGWPAYNNGAVATFCMGGNLSANCDIILEYGDLFVRFHLPVLSPTNTSLLLLQQGGDHVPGEVYVNGAIAYDGRNDLDFGGGVLVDVTENLVRGDNHFAVRFKELGNKKALEPMHIDIAATLLPWKDMPNCNE